MSSRDRVTEFRQQEFTVIPCLHGFFMRRVLFLFAAAAASITKPAAMITGI